MYILEVLLSFLISMYNISITIAALKDLGICLLIDFPSILPDISVQTNESVLASGSLHSPTFKHFQKAPINPLKTHDYWAIVLWYWACIHLVIPNRDHSNWGWHGIYSNNKNKQTKHQTKKTPKKQTHIQKKTQTNKKEKTNTTTQPRNTFYPLSTYQTTSLYRDR